MRFSQKRIVTTGAEDDPQDAGISSSISEISNHYSPRIRCQYQEDMFPTKKDQRLGGGVQNERDHALSPYKIKPC